jgi:glycosyltransferase involved in cell wall biosynthesis
VPKGPTMHRLLEWDLAGPFTAPAESSRHEAVRLLVRREGSPLGWVELPNDARALAPDLVGAAVARALAREIWEAGLQHRLRPVRDAPSDTVLVTVVVCTRDRPEQLRGCLDALATQTYEPFEVLVVDNAPTDDRTRDLAAEYQVRYACEPTPGLDWARNLGWQEAGGEIVAYTDDDARPDAGWIAALARQFATPQIAGVTGLVVPAELETQAQWLFEEVYGGMAKGFRAHRYSDRGRLPTYHLSRYGAGCNMAFRRSALEALHGFDPALDVGTVTCGGGDLDAFQRVLESGATLVYSPDAIVRHLHRREMRQLRRQLLDNGRGFSAALWAALRRARGKERFRVVLEYCSFTCWWHLRRIVRRIVRREAMPMRLILVEAFGMLWGPGRYTRARRRARELELAADTGTKRGEG